MARKETHDARYHDDRAESRSRAVPGRPGGPAGTAGTAFGCRTVQFTARDAAGHVADAEVHWPDEPGSPLPGQAWAVEAELTPKGTQRTTAVMTTLLARTGGPQPVYVHRHTGLLPL